MLHLVLCWDVRSHVSGKILQCCGLGEEGPARGPPAVLLPGAMMLREEIVRGFYGGKPKAEV